MDFFSETLSEIIFIFCLGRSRKRMIKTGNRAPKIANNEPHSKIEYWRTKYKITKIGGTVNMYTPKTFGNIFFDFRIFKPAENPPIAKPPNTTTVKTPCKFIISRSSEKYPIPNSPTNPNKKEYIMNEPECRCNRDG